MKDRIREIIEYLEISQAEFAAAIGVQRANVTHFVTGRNKPKLDIVQKILVKYPMINAEWLIIGSGEMLKENSKNNKSKQQNLFTNSIQNENEKNVNKQNESLQSNEIVNNSNNISSKQNSNNDTKEKEELASENISNKDSLQNNNLQNNNQTPISNNNNSSIQTPISNNNSQSVNIISSSPDHIVVLFDDQTFITYRKRN